MTIIVVKLGLYLLSYSFDVHQRNHDNHCSKTWPLPVVVHFDVHQRNHDSHCSKTWPLPVVVQF